MDFHTLALFVTLAGFCIGLGAVSVIETLGFLGRHSSYWTQTTIRTHKVTKPFIWAGMIVAVFGSVWFYSFNPLPTLHWVQLIVLILMTLNGSWLTFWLSPRLLQREREGRDTELLPASWQIGTTLSFFGSIAGWWSQLAMLAWYLTNTH